MWIIWLIFTLLFLLLAIRHYFESKRKMPKFDVELEGQAAG